MPSRSAEVDVPRRSAIGHLDEEFGGGRREDRSRYAIECDRVFVCSSSKPMAINRDLTADEVSRLLAAALSSVRPFRGMSGEDRYYVYATALRTGFRAAELASLRPASFDLTADPPTATVAAAYTKNGEQTVQPLPSALAAALQPYLACRPADDLLWPGTWAKDACEMMARDLGAAREAWIAEADDAEERERRERSGFLAYENDSGKADFHATRHSYITDLARSGVHPKMAQSLARHSTITLTLDRYTHVSLCDQAAALANLPDILDNATPHVSFSPNHSPAADAACGRVRTAEEEGQSDSAAVTPDPVAATPDAATDTAENVTARPDWRLTRQAECLIFAVRHRV